MARLLTLLDIVSQAALEIGITQQRVQTVVSTEDQDISQMRALMHAVADEVLLEEPYLHTLGDGVWINDASGNAVEQFTSDGDVVLFDGRLAINGLKWRFLAGKNLEFGEAQRDFIARQNKIAGRVNARVLDLNEEEGRVQ